MITFQQLCEWNTSEHHHNFYFRISWIKYLTEDELKLIHIEYIDGSVAHSHNPDLCLFWYPVSKWKEHLKQKEDYYKKLGEKLLLEAQEKLWELENEIFPDDLPTMKELIEKRISASLKDDHAGVKAIDKQIKMRARKDAL